MLLLIFVKRCNATSGRVTSQGYSVSLHVNVTITPMETNNVLLRHRLLWDSITCGRKISCSKHTLRKKISISRTLDLKRQGEPDDFQVCDGFEEIWQNISMLHPAKAGTCSKAESSKIMKVIWQQDLEQLLVDNFSSKTSPPNNQMDSQTDGS